MDAAIARGRLLPGLSGPRWHACPHLYEEEIARYCAFRNVTLTEVFSDIDYSGYKRSEKRPALADLIDRRREFSAVIVPKLARFGRSLRHLVQLFETFDSDGISLVFLDMNIDTATSQGRLLRHIMAAFAEYESDVKADYARANYRHAMFHGRPWGKPPFGYRSEDKCYLVVPDEAAIVRQIYARYASGATLNRIATEFNNSGLHRRGGSLWSANLVGRVLDSPAYAGLTSLDGELFPAEWEAVVERDLWDEVQRQRLPQNRGQRVRKVGTGGPYLLSGLIVCGTCGANAHHHRNGRSSKYQCMRHTQGAVCSGGGVTSKRADRIVTQELLARVRFSIEGATFPSSQQAWVKASLAERRRVLAAVLDRVVIESRPSDVPKHSVRSLRLEWKPAFDADLVVTPLEPVADHGPVPVRQSRPQSHRAGRAAKASRDRAAARRRYFEDWRAVRERLIPDLSRRP